MDIPIYTVSVKDNRIAVFVSVEIHLYRNIGFLVCRFVSGDMNIFQIIFQGDNLIFETENVDIEVSFTVLIKPFPHNIRPVLQFHFRYAGGPPGRRIKLIE